MLCCSPHLFSVATLPQENKVPFNYACTCESVPLTAAIMLMTKTYRLNKTIQIHNIPIRKCHNLCSKCPPSADTKQRRRLRHSSMASSITRCGTADHASTNRCFSLHCCVSADQFCKVTALYRCGEHHNINMLQIFSATFLSNIVKFGQHLIKLLQK